MILKTAKPADGEAMQITRRTALGFLAAVAVPSAGAVAASAATTRPTLDELPASATPAECVKFYSNGLMQAMAEIHPERLWTSQIDHEGFFALIVGRAVK